MLVNNMQYTLKDSKEFLLQKIGLLYLMNLELLEKNAELYEQLVKENDDGK